MKIKEEALFFLGPVTLLCAIALSPIALTVAIPGLVLSSYFRMRGFAYSLLLLSFAIFLNHGFLAPNHFWQFGLEFSLACSFWITALGQEERAQISHSLYSQAEASQATSRNLEEELGKCQEEKTAAQTIADSKVSSLQNRIEEVEKEYASIQILNEVLRKTAAHHIEEKNELEKGSIDLQRKIGWMRQEIDRYEQKRSERDLLMRELNQARVDKEQTHLINETLAKLHAQKCQEIEEIRSHSLEESHGPSQFELLYHQLRKQFDDKNLLLHKTRQELFYKETELEIVRIQQSEEVLSLDSLFSPIQQEVEALVQETSSLKEENSQLLELVSAILAQQPSSGRKKKVKTKVLPLTEAMLF